MIGNKINKAIVKSILIILFTFIYTSVPAQSETDSITNLRAEKTVDFRIPQKEKIEKYKEDSRFNYKRIEKKPNWWDQLKGYILNLLEDIFISVARSGMPGMLVLIVIVVLICLLVLKFFGVDYRKILGKKTIDTPEIDIYTENVHEMDFDSLIGNAMKNKDYRLVIRFLYLKNLKLLSDKEIIEWKKNKTNYSYQHEIKNNNIRTKFLENTLIFDYIWYGEFVPDEKNFSEIYTQMNEFSKMIGHEK